MKILLIALTLFPLLLQAADGHKVSSKEGEYLGAIPSELPEWFKESFLDFAEDVAEAAEENKRVMLYFHQPGCPYCAKLVNENFTDENLKQYIQQNFDGITINMWGDREIVSVANKTFTEKEFALALKVQYTPTIIFLNEQGKVALRLNGYYPPEKFRLALQYVADHLETKTTFSEYVQANLNDDVKQVGLIDEDFFIKTLNLQSLVNDSSKATAVYFEKKQCADCLDMHHKILTDQTTRDIVVRMNNVQLDIESKQTIVTPNGESLTVNEWANQLNVGYLPSVVFFDKQGEEVMRIGGFIKSFHFQSVFDYVFEEGYKKEPSFQRYIAARGEYIRALGYDTDIWGYRSAYTLQQIEK